MKDKHVDLDAEDSKVKSSTAANPDNPEFEVEFEFEDDDSNKSNRYRFFGFQSLPEMMNDFIKNPQKTINEFIGRTPGDWDSRGGVKMRQRFDELVPEETRQHFRSAQKQLLLGWRELINRQLERIEAEEEFSDARQEAETGIEKPEKKSTEAKVEIIED